MSDMAGERILVVDDIESGRYIKSRVLRAAGFETVEAQNGHEALALARAATFQLVILDVKLPDIDGFEVCRRLKAEFSSLSVLQTSAAFTGRADRMAGLEGGADAYLIEPIDPHELITTVKALLRLHRAEHELRQMNATLEQKVEERTAALTAANARLEDELHQRAVAEEALRHAQRLDALGRVTGGIAHDFNNLLTVILGSFSRIDRALSKIPPDLGNDLRPFVGGGQQAALDCAHLTRQLLAFARKEKLRVETLNVNDRLSRFKALLHRAVGEQVSLELSLSPEVWLCRADPTQLESAILNLAVNARDAMPNGGAVCITTKNVELYPGQTYDDIPIPPGAPAGRFVCVMVADTGTGMSADVLEHAFEPFFTTKDIGKGTGLGLSQVYGFVTQSGGCVGVDSMPGRGTRIAVFLPVSEEHAQANVGAADDRQLPNGRETILVVEDNYLVLASTTQTLTELGYTVLEASNGARALEWMRSNTPVDVLFTDIVMPDRIGGIEVANEARRTRPDLRVLLTSGYSADAIKEEPSTGSFAYLPKPYTPEALARRLREVLEP